jgi:hypothetical protein
MRIITLLSVLLAAFLPGCGGFGTLVPGQSTQSDVRASMGAPTEVRNDRGDELWEYAGGAEGHETYRVRIGADGRVKEVTQIVTQERLLSLTPGKTTRQEVRELLGRPAEERMTGIGETWSWRTVVDGGLRGHLYVSFNANGTVRDRGAVIDAINYDSSP